MNPLNITSDRNGLGWPSLLFSFLWMSFFVYGAFRMLGTLFFGWEKLIQQAAQ